MSSEAIVSSRRYGTVELEELRQKFPAYFKELPCKCPHNEAYPQRLTAYRLCINQGKLTKDDFIPSNQEKRSKPLAPDNPSTYSASLIKDQCDVEKVMTYRSSFGKIPRKGTIRESHGFTRHSPSKSLNSHYDFWQYESAEPWAAFLLNEDDERNEE